jgi:hypothetical protein
MKNLADEMDSAGKKVDPEEFTSYVLAGLDMDCNSAVSAIATRVEPITRPVHIDYGYRGAVKASALTTRLPDALVCIGYYPLSISVATK